MDNIIARVANARLLGEESIMPEGALSIADMQGKLEMKVGEERVVNLWNTGLNKNSLAFGQLNFIYQGNNEFSILKNNFNFEIFWNQGLTGRNVGTGFGWGVCNNIYLGPLGLAIPIFFGGTFSINFYGTITVPKFK